MKTVTIVGFGDSITHDVYVKNEDERWLNVLNSMLSEAYPDITFNVINSGVGGNSDREKMARFETDVLDQKPDILLVEFGGNNGDYKNPERLVPVEETKQYLEEIKASIASSTHVVNITFPLVLWEKHCYYTSNPEEFKKAYEATGGPEGTMNLYRDAITEFSKENNYPVVELYRAMKDLSKEEVANLQTGDGVHLNAKGDRLLATMVFKTLSEEVIPSLL